MGTTIAISDETHAWLTRFKQEAGLRSMDDVLGTLAHAGEHMAERLFASRRESVEAACHEHGISRLVAFGSRVWGAPHAASDVDLVAEFRAPPSLFDVIRASDALEAAFGVRVDLATWGALKPRLADRVRRDGVVLVG